MADAAVEAADEEHGGRDAGCSQDRRVVAGPGGQLDDRQAPPLDLIPEGGERTLGHRNGLEAKVRLELERGDEAVEPGPIGGADVDGDTHAAGDHVRGAGLDVDLADGADRALYVGREVANPQDVLRRRDERVVAAGHRHRSRVPRLAGEGALAADDAHDPPRETDRRTGAFEDGPLLHVHLEEALGELAALDERGAADAAGLLLPEADASALADAFDRLDRRHDAEGAVELAAVGHGVEVRAGPDAGVLRPADQVAGGIDLDLQAGVAHPAGGEVVRVILVRRAADAVRPGAAAEGIELV